MATALSPLEAKKNPTTYCLIWLDPKVNISSVLIKAQQQLRTSINYLLTFTDDEQCLKHILSSSPNDHIILIVSGSLGRIIVPKIAKLQQIISIYVYCMDKKRNEHWAQHFSKAKGVIIQLDELIHQIQINHLEQPHDKINEALPMSVFDSSEGQSSTELNGQFIHFQLLIDCLIRMETSLNERQELITFCKQQYKDDPSNLSILKTFEENYSSDWSLWWYTNESFFYQLLNKALRTQNIDLLYLFRFFIRDIGTQLEKHKCSSSIRVYRIQTMSKEEIEILKKSVGQYISMNSFLSTSLSQDQVEQFLKPESSSEVYFKINADPRMKITKPFSDISSFGEFPSEREVLFMIGSIFRVTRMKCDSKGVWNIELILCSDDDHQLHSLFQHMKNELGIGKTDLHTFGNVLKEMGKLDDAEKYYHRYFNQLSDGHPRLSHCYHSLGDVANLKGDYESSLKWYNKSLAIKQKTLKSNDLSIAEIYNNIGEVYRKKDDSIRAIESYTNALRIWTITQGENHPDVAACLNNMGLVYQKDRKALKALECFQKVLTIWRNRLPADHHHFGAVYNNMGLVHKSLGQHDLALKYYDMTLSILKKSLPPIHPHIAMTFENIALTYEEKGDFQKALSYCEEAAKIYRQSFSSTHSNVIRIKDHTTRISSRMTGL